VTISTATTTVAAGRGPMIGLAAQVGLLAALAGPFGLTAAGLATGVAYGVVLCGLLGAGLRRCGMVALGPANVVTLGRALLVGGVTAVVVTSFGRPVSVPALVTLAGFALALDGLDGQVARRTGTTSALGARFDMEIDAFLILVLSVYAGDRFGWWTVAIGGFRYVFAAASWPLPWLNAALPPRFSRKVVAAVQGVVLALVTANLLPPVVAGAALILALGSLTWSFGRDIAWLHQARQAGEATRQAHEAARQAGEVARLSWPAPPAPALSR
jgi:phosphatidylglycerophosphate synthase